MVHPGPALSLLSWGRCQHPWCPTARGGPPAQSSPGGLCRGPPLLSRTGLPFPVLPPPSLLCRSFCSSRVMLLSPWSCSRQHTFGCSSHIPAGKGLRGNVTKPGNKRLCTLISESKAIFRRLPRSEKYKQRELSGALGGVYLRVRPEGRARGPQRPRARREPR